ncbi:MAG: tryptophan 2,3-dioxygenase [Candidatus Thiodiazotropha sp. (ex Monitilora ramsayi)]|nr:tryptophan 2,3-dioxygenase [Candidatus Thiodiazotropha sp. (ex Monitilora ramsayi)]
MVMQEIFNQPTPNSDDSEQLTYTSYLQLDRLLNAQQPRSEPHHHDELLFIIQHQVSELWMKLILHELQSAVAYIRADELNPCFKILARVKLVQVQLFEQWAVLETLTPSEYAAFRNVLGSTSGFQSPQYRMIEFLLGEKDAEMLVMFEYDDAVYERVRAVMLAPSIYDEFLRHLARRGYAVPKVCLERDWSQPHERNEQLIEVFTQIYEDPERDWDAYALCEKLVDVEEQFQLWRFRHMKTVERIIGYKRGTGGSAGVAYLRKAIDKRFFPELFDVRTRIGE